MSTENPPASPSLPIADQAVAPARRIKSTLWRELWKHRTEYLLISPFFVIFAIFHGYPLVWSLWLSLQRWQGIGEPRWFGLGNYERLLTNDKTWGALGNSLIFLVFLLPVIVAATLVLAAILNSSRIVGRNVFRALY